MKRVLLTILALAMVTCAASAQSERSSVRRGNRDFRKEKFAESEIEYKKALLADSLSNAASYNLGNTYFRMENYAEADKAYNAVADSLSKTPHAADMYHNMGNSLLAQKNYRGAIEAYKNSLRRNPGDMETKANLAYAQKMLQDEQNNQNQAQNQDQNKDQNQDQQGQTPPPQISQQDAQQMLQAIQDKEKDTQDKVKKEKALQMRSKQKEKNW